MHPVDDLNKYVLLLLSLLTLITKEYLNKNTINFELLQHGIQWTLQLIYKNLNQLTENSFSQETESTYTH